MKVRDCMAKEVVSVKRSTALTELIQIFKKYNFHTLPVVEENNLLVGIVTFEDILKVFQPYSPELLSMLKTIPLLEVEEPEEDLLLADISSEMGVLVVADDLMNTQFATIDPESNVNQARSLMKLHNAARVAVVENGALVGIISLFDIILAIFKDKGLIK